MNQSILSFFVVMTSLICFDNVSAQWKQLYAGPSNASVNSITGNGSVVLFVFNGDSIYSSIDYGATWTDDVDLPNWSIIYSLTMLGTNVYANTHSGLFVSADSGKTWGFINSSPVTGTLVKSGPNLISSEVGYSSDSGRTWNAGANFSIGNCLAVSGSSVYEGTVEGVSRSTDNGESWTQINDTLGEITSIVASGSTIVAAWRHPPVPVYDSLQQPLASIFRSTDNGKTWSTFLNGISPQVPFCLTGYGPDVFAGGPGVFSSDTDGNAWINTENGLPEGLIEVLYADDSSIFAGTSEDGIWRAPLSQVLGVKEPLAPPLPISFQLEQNYPNPFNPTTTISYQLPDNSYVTLRVYNVLGEQVESLVNGSEAPGAHSARFDASRLASGIYLYRIDGMASNGDRYVSVKKMVLIK
jgi:hypothetical protein